MQASMQARPGSRSTPGRNARTMSTLNSTPSTGIKAADVTTCHIPGEDQRVKTQIITTGVPEPQAAPGE